MTSVGGAPSRTCRPYRIGDHASALRRHLIRALIIGFVVALVVPSAVRAIASAILEPDIRANDTPAVVEAIDDYGFAVAFLTGAWLAVGPRRWAAIEILVWGSRYAAAGYTNVTGIRDNTDPAAAAEWLRTHPPSAAEAPEVTYWRAYAHLVGGDIAGTRATVESISGVEGYRFAVASLRAQADLAEGVEPDLAAVETALETSDDALDRAVAAANLGALRAQRAWSCDADDIGAALTVRPLMGGHASFFLLTRVWLPIVAVTALVTIIGASAGP